MTSQVKSKKKPNIGLIIGIGVGVIALAVAIYFIFFHSSDKPPTPPQDCGKTTDGTEVAGDCGNINCCSKDKPECCAGVPDSKTGSGSSCYSPKESHCLSGQGLLCPLKNLCSYTDPTTGSVSYECCGYGTNKTAPLCDKTSGKCIDCTPANPACGGQSSGSIVTPPFCCGKGTDAKANCYVDGEKTDSSNPCVCCGVEDGNPAGYGGGCCSKDRCKQTDYRGKKLPTSICCPKVGQVVTLDGHCCDPLDIDPITGNCGIKWGNYCASLSDDGVVTTSICDEASGQGCSDPSVCYVRGDEFTEISCNSPLSGTCSGMSGTAKASVCVKSGSDYFSSSFTSCVSGGKCDDGGEVCVTLPYYSLPSASSAKCVIPKDQKSGTCGPGSKNPGMTCSKDADCGGPSTPLKCKINTDCPGYGIPAPYVSPDGKSGPCIQITSADFDKPMKPVYKGKFVKATMNQGKVYTCTGPQVLRSGACKVGCPQENPTTYCDSNQVCDESTTTEGKFGYCVTKNSPITGATWSPEGVNFDTMPLDTSLTLKECQAWCEPGGNADRAGRCVHTNNGKGNSVWACRLSVCEEIDENDKSVDDAPLHLVEGGILSNNGKSLRAQAIQTYKGTPGAGTCYKDGNFYGATDISYKEGDGGATCTTTFLCGGPKSKEGAGILMGPQAASNPGTGPVATKCYGGSGQSSGADLIMCTPFSRSTANLSSCNTCGENKKCVITGGSCKIDTDCPTDPYAKPSTQQDACMYQPYTEKDGLMQNGALKSATAQNSLCTESRDTNGDQYAKNGPATPSTGAFCYTANDPQCGGIDPIRLCQTKATIDDFVGI